MNTCVSCAGFDILFLGCFTHYATLRHHDANFSRYEKAGGWLTTFDTFSTAMFVDGDFALNVYLPYMLVGFFPLFSERGAPKVERDTTDWDVC
jgi:chromosome transmission fidelity protein 18